MDGSLAAAGTLRRGVGIPVRTVHHAFPHIGGASTRVKSEPAHLNRLAATIMASSGAFTGEARRTAGSPVRLLAVIALAFSALSIALAGAGPSPVANTSVPAAVALLPDAFYTLGMDDARAAQAAEPEELAHLGSQDRFEIARFHRLYQAARAKQEAERAAPPRNRR